MLAEKEEKAAEVPVVSDVPGVPNTHQDGDITDVLCAGQDAVAKKKLVQKLNKDEEVKRKEALNPPTWSSRAGSRTGRT